MMESAQRMGQPFPVNLIKLPFGNTPIETFTKLYKHCRYAYLLESIEGSEKLAQYSFIGFNPRLVIRVKGREAVIEDTGSGEKRVARARRETERVSRRHSSYNEVCL